MEERLFLQQSSTRSRRELLTVLFKYQWMIVTVLFAVVAIVMTVTFCRAPVYLARASVLVKFGREYLNNPGVGDNKPLLSVSQEEAVNSELEILRQPDLVRKVISSMKLQTIYPEIAAARGPGDPMEEAVTAFRRSLKVEGVKKSNVILASFEHTDPKIAARALNLLVQFYTEKHLQVFSDPKASFLERQLGAYERKLADSENTLQEFKRKNSVFSLEEQRTLLLKQRSDLDTSHKYALNAVQELKRRLATLNREMASVSGRTTGLYTNTPRDTIIVQAKNNLLTLELKEQNLLKKYTEQNRFVVDVRKEIEVVKKFLAEQEADIRDKVKSGNPVYQNVEIELLKARSDLSSQSARAASLGAQLAQLDREIRVLDVNEKEARRLQRERAVDEKNYRAYRDRSESARISDSMNRLQLADISVIQKATVPARPEKPKKLLNLALSLVLGSALALGLAFFSAHTSQTFSFPEEAAQKLALPLLATVTCAGAEWGGKGAQK